jgi:hypothetical protein
LGYFQLFAFRSNDILNICICYFFINSNITWEKYSNNYWIWGHENLQHSRKSHIVFNVFYQLSISLVIDEPLSQVSIATCFNVSWYETISHRYLKLYCPIFFSICRKKLLRLELKEIFTQKFFAIIFKMLFSYLFNFASVTILMVVCLRGGTLILYFNCVLQITLHNRRLYNFCWSVCFLNNVKEKIFGKDLYKKLSFVDKAS